MTNEIQARVMIRKFECTWSADQSVIITPRACARGKVIVCCRCRRRHENRQISTSRHLQWHKKMFLNRGAIKYIVHKVHGKFLDQTSMPSNHAHFCANLAVKQMLIHIIS